jgi:hypothetical protein
MTVRGRARALLLATLTGALAGVAALAATSSSWRTGDARDRRPATVAAPRRTGDRSPATINPPTRQVTHTFTREHVGPVWVTVTVSRPGDHDLEVLWGPWRKRLHQTGLTTVTYWFEKRDADAIPVTAEVPARARVDFGEGPPPPGAVDARPGWTREPTALG